MGQACLQVKKGPLAETSPMLNDISAVPSWAKVTPLQQANQETCTQGPLAVQTVLLHVLA